MFGAPQALLLLPRHASAAVRQGYMQLAQDWQHAVSGQLDVRWDDEVTSLPADRSIWLWGWDNRWRAEFEGRIVSIDGRDTLDVRGRFLLQGAPVPAEATEIALAWRDVDRFAAWPERGHAQRWNERWQEFGYRRIDPREPGPYRWETVVGEIRAVFPDELPESIEVRHDGQGYRVVPLALVELAEPAAADLLRRFRRTGSAHQVARTRSASRNEAAD